MSDNKDTKLETPKPEGTSDEFFNADTKAPQQLHRQPRGYLKTSASLVGKDTSQSLVGKDTSQSLVGKDTSQQKSLFDIPHFDDAIYPYKETFTKMTAITGNLLLALWQANKDDNNIYKITNLSEIARLLKVRPEELKLYLIYLGGYQRPITKLEIIKEAGKKDKRILSMYSDKIFYIKFKTRLKDNEKEEDFKNDARIGTGYLSFIKDRDIESVDIRPSESIQEELGGDGLGNVLVDDSFVAFILGLSDLAYKLFCFSGSNKPTFKIGFNKLIGEKYLNLEKQLKAQGKPRVLKAIINGLAELKEKGHLAKWDYAEQTDFFSWTYTNAVIKHKELLIKGHTKALNPPDQTKGTDQTGQDETG